MRLFCLASILLSVSGCGGDDCTTNTACTPGSIAHYQFCNSGKADDCYYLTGDGMKLHCVTCGDCSDAQSEVTDWCQTQPDKPTTGGTTGNTTGAVCTSASCPLANNTYEFCAMPNGTDCSYRTSDGTTYSCNSCSDCTSAVTNVTNWCTNGGSTTNTSGSTSTTGGTTGGSDSACATSSDCQDCCASLHAAGATDYRNLYTACTCPLCSSQCGGVSECASNTSDCISCLTSAAQSSCETTILEGCSNNSDCNAYVTCAEHCTTS